MQKYTFLSKLRENISYIDSLDPCTFTWNTIIATIFHITEILKGIVVEFDLIKPLSYGYKVMSEVILESFVIIP